MEHRSRAEDEALGISLQFLTDLDELARLPVPDCDYEVRVNEEQDLAELDDFDWVDITSRLDDAEQSLAVGLQLGALVGIDGIFHR